MDYNESTTNLNAEYINVTLLSSNIITIYYHTYYITAKKENKILHTIQTILHKIFNQQE